MRLGLELALIMLMQLLGLLELPAVIYIMRQGCTQLYVLLMCV